MEREARYNYVLGAFKSDVLFVFPQNTRSLDAFLTDTNTYPGQSSRTLANPGDPLWVLALIPGWEHEKIRANSYESWRNSSASSSNKPSQRFSNILPKPFQNHVKILLKTFYTLPNILPNPSQNLSWAPFWNPWGSMGLHFGSFARSWAPEAPQKRFWERKPGPLEPPGCPQASLLAGFWRPTWVPKRHQKESKIRAKKRHQKWPKMGPPGVPKLR